MTTQAAASSSTSPSATSGANGLLNLISSQPSAKTQGTSVSDQFKALLQELASGQVGQSNLTPQQLAALLAKQESTTSGASASASQLQTKIKSLLDADSAHSTTTDGSDPSAALISEIAGLMQKYPALQQLFTGNINTQQLQQIGDALAKGGANPDLSGLQLPDDLKSNLTALAQDPKASAALQDAAAQLTANPALANEVPQALQNFAAMMSQKNNSTNALAQAAASDGDDDNATVAANNQTGTGKTRPQGLLKYLDNAQQAAQSSNATAQPAVAADSKANTNAFQFAASDSSAIAAAADDDAGTTQSFFTLATDGVSSPNLTAEQTNALMLNGRSNVSLGGVADAAYTAQQLSNAASANPAAMQVAVQLQRNAQANNNNFTMQLYPAELGRIDVSLRFSGGKVTAKISADKQETLDSLKQDSGSLTSALQDAGLQTDAGSLEFSLGNSAQQFAEKSQNNNSDNQFGTLLATNTTDETSITQASGSQWITLGTGRVDVKL